jgi:streptomycin 6-kinase
MTPFTEYLHCWSLIVDGTPIETEAAALLPVIWRDTPAMLKLSTSQEEMRGYDLLEWWEGNGAARVFARSGAALLMERASAARSLAQLSRSGHDERACAILCDTVAQLHQAHQAPPPTLVLLDDWFAALHSTQDVKLLAARNAMQELLAQPRDISCLHGDIHHLNILDFGKRGWLAIDPKGLIGERTFDYANLFCNPDLEIAANPDIFLSRVSFVGGYAKLDSQRLLKWILAWSGLSAAWHFEDGSSPEIALQIAGMAAAALGD